MKTVYYSGIDNVGDELNRFIWPALFGPEIEDGTALLGVGTLLDENFCRRLDSYKRIIVLGSGAGYGSLPTLDSRWQFQCVRGLQTSRALGLDDSKAIADAAYLLATLDWASIRASAPSEVAVIPHHSSLRFIDWSHICSEAGFTLVSPLLPASQFFESLSKARIVVTEAIHGAILADVLRIPWVPFRFGKDFLDSKWLDWMGMFSLAVQAKEVPSFYDPDICYLEKGQFFHLHRKLKVSLARNRLGKRKWLTMMEPGASRGSKADQLCEVLMQLAMQPGWLSSETVFERQVERLYGSVSSIAPEVAPLSGAPLSLFNGS